MALLIVSRKEFEKERMRWKACRLSPILTELQLGKNKAPAPHRADALSGARSAHFDGYTHEEPPEYGG